MALLELKDLHTFFRTKKGIVKAVNGVSYSVEAGRTLGVVGESGSGKSVSAMSILQLLDGNGYIDSGEILFEGRDLTQLSEKCTPSAAMISPSSSRADDQPEPGLHRVPSGQRAVHYPSGHDEEAGCRKGH